MAIRSLGRHMPRAGKGSEGRSGRPRARPQLRQAACHDYVDRWISQELIRHQYTILIGQAGWAERPMRNPQSRTGMLDRPVAEAAAPRRDRRPARRQPDGNDVVSFDATAVIAAIRRRKWWLLVPICLCPVLTYIALAQ